MDKNIKNEIQKLEKKCFLFKKIDKICLISIFALTFFNTIFFNGNSYLFYICYGILVIQIRNCYIQSKTKDKLKELIKENNKKRVY